MSFHSLRRAFFACLATVILGAGVSCTDADIFETPGLGSGSQDNKLKVTGSFCTEHPDELKFPVKIMFIIDCSQSMNITDPPPTPNDYPGRVKAVWDVIQKFRYDPGVSYAILRFEAAANVATQADTNGDGIADMFGFVSDLPSLLRALNSLISAGGNTSYQAALGLAEATLAMDMSTTTVDERSRTKYVVILLSDGLPYPQDFEEEINTPASIRRALTEMMNLPKRFDVSDFTFHTAYLSVDTPIYIKEQAEALLKDLAAIGGGTYRNFDNGEEINFLDIDYTSIKRMYSIKNGAFIVANENAHPAWSRSESVDTDGDGLVDLIEEELGTSIGSRDTDGDGFNDLLEYNLRRSGFDPLDPDDADCSLGLDRLDRDGDSLLDCEERFIGTSPELFDTDADGLPDPLEFRGGTNPVWADASVDMDFDGSPNGSELAWHTDPALDDAARFSKLAYRYKLSRRPGYPESRVCYDFSVDNITLVGTQPRSPGEPEGFNDVMVYFGQVPQDDPEDYGTFRVACARTRYIPRYPEPDIKYPPSGVVKFEQKDFKRPVATRCANDLDCPHHVCDPNLHVCLAPLGDKCDDQTPCPNFACADIDAASGVGTCVFPVQVSCLNNDDCPPYPVHPATQTCMDPTHAPPDPVTGACPLRECIPQYFTCSATKPCAPDGDSNPDNDPECLGGLCRSPCTDAGDCNPGETCEADIDSDYPQCQAPADCPVAGMECDGGRCMDICTIDADCPDTGDVCEDGLCVRRHCVDHHGGSCAGVPCFNDADCPLQPCDPEVGRCLTQPCLDSRECENQKCELVLGFCLGTECADDADCRGDRGYTCNEVIGDPCDRDIDCPIDFCTQEKHQCFLSGGICTDNTDCVGNTCGVRLLTACLTAADCPGGTACTNGVCVGSCSMGGNNSCSSDLDCSPNYCQTYYVCENDPNQGCTSSLDCPQTFCRADGVCTNDTNVSCNPDTENIDNACQVGMCARQNDMGNCDTLAREPCSTSADCPNYACNMSTGECHYPSEVACTTAADCPEAGMQCDVTGFCVKFCNSDTECPQTRCQGRCVPADPADRFRCMDWFDPDRDCKVFGVSGGSGSP
ncbi:MAG TPA: VWA domain-containing protein [Myxococcota bacterium]|nr:VWA domain-containing protein [Myxococcota bacterium]